MPLTVSQSTIAVFDRCRRRWWLSHYRSLGRPADYKSPTTVGDLVHDALAQYYAGAYGDAPIFLEPIAWVKQHAIATIEAKPDFAEEIANDAELAGIMVDGYMNWLIETGADSDFEHVEPEREIRTRLADGIELIGKLDGKVLTRDGWTGFLEHKSVGNFTDLPSYAQLNRQLLTYDLLEYLEIVETGSIPFPKVDGAILNMLRRVKRTARAEPPFYLRHRVQHNVEELRNHWRHTLAIALEIANATARLDAGESHQLVAPPTPARDCRYSCIFFTVCPMFDDGSDVEVVLDFEYEKVDPFERYATEVDA
jgi:hypothetical protein